jgi:hypothetical protein
MMVTVIAIPAVIVSAIMIIPVLAAIVLPGAVCHGVVTSAIASTVPVAIMVVPTITVPIAIPIFLVVPAARVAGHQRRDRENRSRNSQYRYPSKLPTYPLHSLFSFVWLVLINYLRETIEMQRLRCYVCVNDLSKSRHIFL